MRSIARVLALLVVLACVAPFVIYAAPVVIGGDHSFVVLSGSMQPAMAPGDVVVVEETNPATIDEETVITFVRAEEDAPTTHRVVDVRRQDGRLAFETKGDANEDPDPELVPAGNVLGTVTLTIPLIGHVIQFANTPLGFLALLAGPLCLLALTEVWALTSASTGTTSREATDDLPAAPDTPTETVTDTTDGDDRITLGPGDLTATTALLVLVTPYAVHVALQLQTALTFSVAFASAFLLLSAGGVRITVWRANGTAGEPVGDRRPDEEMTASTPVADERAADDEAPTPAPDGGQREEAS